MMYISKKRLGLIVSVVIVSVFSFSFVYKNNQSEMRSAQTVALPVSNKVVVLDARTWQSR